MGDQSYSELSQTELRPVDGSESAGEFPAHTEPLQRLDELSSLLDKAEQASVGETQDLTASPAGQPSQNDDEVAQYMASLMERYGIKGEEPAAPTTAAPASTAPSAEEDVADAEVVAEEAEETRAPRTPAAAPERDMDMSSLREIANQTARTAVNAHMSGQIVSAAYTKLILAFVAMLSSALCGAASPSVGSTFYYVAVGAALAAFYWVGQFWSLTGELHGFTSQRRHNPN